MFQAKSKQQGKSKAINPSNPFGSINPNDFIPKRFGLHYQRPTIILEYLVPSTGKLYHHKMRLEQKLKNNLAINEILNHVRERHAEYLIDIRDEQLIKLITTLKNDNQKGQKGMTQTITKKATPLQSTNQNQQQTKIGKLEPLAKLEPLGKLQPLGIKKPEIKKNTFEDDVDDILNDLGFPENKPNPKIQQKNLGFPENKPNSQVSYEKKNQTANSFFTPKDERDLNKLTTEELQIEKKKMDGKFFQNQKKPGDNGFKYDIQEDFEPYEDNEWDMDEEEDDII